MLSRVNLNLTRSCLQVLCSLCRLLSHLGLEIDRAHPADRRMDPDPIAGALDALEYLGACRTVQLDGLRLELRRVPR